MTGAVRRPFWDIHIHNRDKRQKILPLVSHMGQTTPLY